MALLSVTLLTPDSALKALTPVRDLLKGWLAGSEYLQEFVDAYSEPTVSLVVDFLILPALVDISCLFEDFRRKSSLQISIMWRIYVFMFINTLLLPLSGSSIGDLFTWAGGKSMPEIITVVS